MTTCLTCEYCHEPECRRYPPTHKGFPVVRKDGWCGEFKQKPAPKIEAKPAPAQKPKPEIKDEGKAPDLITVWTPKDGKWEVDLNNDHYSSREEIMAMLDKLDGRYLRRDSRDVLYAKLVASAKAQESLQNL